MPDTVLLPRLPQSSEGAGEEGSFRPSLLVKKLSLWEVKSPPAYSQNGSNWLMGQTPLYTSIHIFLKTAAPHQSCTLHTGTEKDTPLMGHSWGRSLQEWSSVGLFSCRSMPPDVHLSPWFWSWSYNLPWPRRQWQTDTQRYSTCALGFVCPSPAALWNPDIHWKKARLAFCRTG